MLKRGSNGTFAPCTSYLRLPNVSRGMPVITANTEFGLMNCYIRRKVCQDKDFYYQHMKSLKVIEVAKFIVGKVYHKVTTAKTQCARIPVRFFNHTAKVKLIYFYHETSSDVYYST